MKEIELRDCPADLREATEMRLCEQPWPWELLSVTVHESTPYIDKMQILVSYEVILCKSNTFFVLSCTEDGLFPRLSESIFTMGTVDRIIKTAPAWMGLGRPVSVNPN